FPTARARAPKPPNACGSRARQKFIQRVTFTKNTFSGAVRNRSPASRENRNGATSVSECRPCDHTAKTVEPGRYSHLSTALERKSFTLKAGSAKRRSGTPSPVTSAWRESERCGTNRRYRSAYFAARGATTSLKSSYVAAARNGWA